MPIFDAFPGEKLLIRVWDTLEQCGVSFLRPGQMRREGKAKAEIEYQLKAALAQAEKDASDIKSGRLMYDFTTGRVAPPQPPIPVLPSIATLSLPADTDKAQDSLTPTRHYPRLGSAVDFSAGVARSVAGREFQRAINLARIGQFAADDAIGSDDASVSDKEVHADWLARWRENAQDVSDEDIQRLWAQALAGEVKQPGRYSLRTLDFLRSISKEEATLIASLAPLSMGSELFRDDKALDGRGLTFGVLQRLQSLGILSGVEALGVVRYFDKSTDKEPGTHALRCWNLVIVITVSKRLEIPCYSITEIGQQVLSLGRFEADREYLVGLARHICERGHRCAIGQVQEVSADMYRAVPPFEEFTPPPASATPGAG